MSLVRQHNPLGNVIIRQLGDAGGPRSDWTADEINNLITWAAVAPRNIHRNLAATGTVTTGLDNLHSFSLPANSLQADGDYLRVRYGGTFATNDSDKRIQINFDGQVVNNSTLFDIDSGSWLYDIIYARVSSTSVRASVVFMWGNINRDGGGTVGGNGAFSGSLVTVTVANLNNNAVTLLVQGESNASVGTGTDDVVQNLSIIELTQQ